MRQRQAWVITGLLAVFVIGRVIILAGAELYTSYDTYTYAHRGDPAVDRGSLVSLTGHAPRLWGVPAFYALFPDDQARAVAQWTLGTVAWALLAWVLWASLRHLPAKVAGAGAVLVLGLLATIASWDFTILSEPLSISLGVLTLALLLRWLATGSWGWLAAMTASAVWWTFTRPDVRVFIAVLIVGLAVVAWRRRDRLRPAAAAGGVLVLATLWCTVVASTANEEFQRWGALGVTQDEELLIYRLRMLVFSRPEVHATFQREFGMPECPGAQRLAAQPEWAIRDFGQEYRNCPALRDWARADGAAAFRGWALAAPGQYASFLRGATERSLGGASYAQTPRVIPRLVEKLAFPPLRWSPYLLAAGFALVLGAAFATGAVRRRAVLVWTGVVLFAASIGSAVAGEHFAAGEYGRFGIQEAIGTRLALLLIAVAVLDVVLDRRVVHNTSAA